MNSGQPKPENFHDNDQSIQASSSWLNNLLCLKWKSPCHPTLLPSTIPGTGRHQECWLSGWINGWMAGFEGRIYVWFALIHLCNTCIAPDIIYIVHGRCSVSINRITLTSLDLRIVLFKMAESLYSQWSLNQMHKAIHLGMKKYMASICVYLKKREKWSIADISCIDWQMSRLVHRVLWGNSAASAMREEAWLNCLLVGIGFQHTVIYYSLREPV